MGEDGTFSIVVDPAALINDVIAAISNARGINRGTICLYLGGEESALDGRRPFAQLMADADATQLFMLLKHQEWKLLSRQFCAQGGFFSRGERSLNVEDENSPLYLDLAIDYDRYRDPQGRLQLKMVWPSLSDFTKDRRLVKDSMTWFQISTPLEASVSGYAAVDIPYPGPRDKAFGGVELSQGGAAESCIIDGNAGRWNWHYAVASVVKWGAGMPGPIANGKEYAVDKTELWVHT